MNETAAMLEARLVLVDRVRVVEQRLARAAYADTAAAMLRSVSHELGNSIQIVKLAAGEVARRSTQPEIAHLVEELVRAGDRSSELLAELFAAARPLERSTPGPSVGPAISSAVELARGAIAARVDIDCAIPDFVCTACTADEIEAMVIAMLLDASTATKIDLLVRERMIQSKRRVEIVRSDDRSVPPELDVGRALGGPLLVIAAVAKAVDGEVSIAPGRAGLELAIDLPVT
jgi:hypothetical protein